MIDSRKVEAKRSVPKTDSIDSPTGSCNSVANTNVTVSSNSNSSKNNNIASLGRPLTVSGATKSPIKSVGSNQIQADLTSTSGNSNKNNNNSNNQPITTTTTTSSSSSATNYYAFSFFFN